MQLVAQFLQNIGARLHKKNFYRGSKEIIRTCRQEQIDINSRELSSLLSLPLSQCKGEAPAKGLTCKVATRAKGHNAKEPPSTTSDNVKRAPQGYHWNTKTSANARVSTITKEPNARFATITRESKCKCLYDNKGAC